jgi:hypothetical protein
MMLEPRATTRLRLCTGARVAAAAAVGLACVGCGSGHPSKTTRSSHPVVRHHGPAVATSSAVPSSDGPRTPAADDRMRLPPTAHHPTAILATPRPGTATVRLPRGIASIGAGCGGEKPVHVAARRPLPIRHMCPPP